MGGGRVVAYRADEKQRRQDRPACWPRRAGGGAEGSTQDPRGTRMPHLLTHPSRGPPGPALRRGKVGSWADPHLCRGPVSLATRRQLCLVGATRLRSRSSPPSSGHSLCPARACMPTSPTDPMPPTEDGDAGPIWPETWTEQRRHLP